MIIGNAGRAGNAGSSSIDVSDICGRPGGHATSPGGKPR